MHNKRSSGTLLSFDELVLQFKEIGLRYEAEPTISVLSRDEIDKHNSKFTRELIRRFASSDKKTLAPDASFPEVEQKIFDDKYKNLILNIISQSREITIKADLVFTNPTATKIVQVSANFCEKRQFNLHLVRGTKKFPFIGFARGIGLKRYTRHLLPDDLLEIHSNFTNVDTVLAFENAELNKCFYAETNNLETAKSLTSDLLFQKSLEQLSSLNVLSIRNSRTTNTDQLELLIVLHLTNNSLNELDNAIEFMQGCLERLENF